MERKASNVDEDNEKDTEEDTEEGEEDDDGEEDGQDDGEGSFGCNDSFFPLHAAFGRKKTQHVI